MGYHRLTDIQLTGIANQKLLELEAEHARLELDIRVSKATGIENDNVAAGEEQLDLLVRQIATLASWIMPPPVYEASANGHREAVES